MDRENTYETGISAIVDFLRDGENPAAADDGLLGFSLDHFVLSRTGGSPVLYSKAPESESAAPASIESILERLAPLFDETECAPDSNGDLHPVALLRDNLSVTIGAGGQFTVQVDGLSSIGDIGRTYAKLRQELDPILDESDCVLVNLGYHPTACANELPLVPMNFYSELDDMLSAVRTQGACLLRASASTRVSIYYRDEQDCTRKLLVANALSPLLAYITDNAPLFERIRCGAPTDATSSGLPVPSRTVRLHVRNESDPARCLLTPGAFVSAERGLYETYARELYQRIDPADPDVDAILSGLFYDVLLDDCITLDTADSLSPDMALAYAALIKGIFCSDEALDTLYERFAGLSEEDVLNARDRVIADGWGAEVYGTSAYAFFRELFSLASDGLDEDERGFVTPFVLMLFRRMTPVDQTLARR